MKRSAPFHQQTFALPYQERATWYVLLMGAVVFVAALQNAVFAKFLRPEALGYYAIAAVVASYAAFLQLGLLSGLGRELPVLLGMRDRAQAGRLVGETTVVLALASAVALLVFLPTVYTVRFDDTNVRTAIALGGPLAVAAMFAQLVILRMRSERDIVGFPTVLLAQKVLTLTAGAVASWYFGFVALIWVFVVADVLVFFGVTRFRLSPANYRDVRPAELRGLISIGLPMMAGSLLYSFQLNLDKLFLIKMTTPHDLGLYQIAWLPLAMGITLSGIVNQYLAPKLLVEYGATGSLERVLRQSVKLSFALIGGMAAVAPGVYILAGHVIKAWLPAYVASLPSLMILYAGSVLTAANVAGITVYAANRPMLLVWSLAVTAGLSVILYSVLGHYTTDLRWYAAVNVGGIFLDFLSRLGIAYYCVRSVRA